MSLQVCQNPKTMPKMSSRLIFYFSIGVHDFTTFLLL
ncbi:hypothetical protein SOVF_040730 [Spinacia oleracea]|nr:hypothetical protein SOVF_040730 [Spinacia oleracea]